MPARADREIHCAPSTLAELCRMNEAFELGCASVLSPATAKRLELVLIPSPEVRLQSSHEGLLR